MTGNIPYPILSSGQLTLLSMFSLWSTPVESRRNRKTIHYLWSPLAVYLLIASLNIWSPFFQVVVNPLTSHVNLPNESAQSAEAVEYTDCISAET